MATIRIATVPYLNACVLTDGLAQRRDVDLVRAAPSALADLLARGEVDVAMMPSADYWHRRGRWHVAAPYGITCDGTAWTVKVFSNVPSERVDRLYVDAESHSSAALARVIFGEWQGRTVEFLRREFDSRSVGSDDAWLLIGDKAEQGPSTRYVYDLGGMWHDRTALPFVFALWVSADDAVGEQAGPILAQTAERNLGRIEQLAEQYGPKHGFQVARATEYLGRIIDYRIGRRQREGLAHFGRLLDGAHLKRAPA